MTFYDEYGAYEEVWHQVEKPAKAHKANLDTLATVFADGNEGLVETKLRVNIPAGSVVAALAGIAFDGDEYGITPFAIMINGNPFELLAPPDPEGEFHGD